MSVKIRILPEQLANKIAAGEVVERPASVVKELVENSLDAGATEIIVDIEDGGRRLIRVTDNGSGMSKEDALMSMERHATSKISSDADLFALGTLGFRGEALPSIASVSRFSIVSRESSSLEGSEVYAEGGKVKEVKSCGAPVGTAITVRNLFFNTPARLKFMKSRDTETGHVTEIIHRLAFSRPEVRFIYTIDSRQSLRLLSGDFTSRATELLGKGVASSLFRIDQGHEDVWLTGLLGAPDASRSTASWMYTFINGRYIRDRVVQHALLSGYRGVLEKGRYPVLLLFVSIPPADLDVNVHPTKHEVRFREQSKIHQVISGSIETLLRTAPWQRSGRSGPIIPPFQPSASTQRQAPPPAASSASISRIEEVKESLLRYAGTSLDVQTADIQSYGTAPFKVPDRPAPTALPEESCNGYFSSLTVIGQFMAMYIICQDDKDLLLIDQHAAHERVVFEELKNKYHSGGIDAQRLLFPETLEMLPDEVVVLGSHIEHLERLGFTLEHFGGNTWILGAVPSCLANQDFKRTVRDLIAEIGGFGSISALEEKIEDMLATIACHSVVRGATQLGVQQIRVLFNRMDCTDFSSHCPHGRPAVVKITVAEVEKMFKRI